MIVDDMKQQLFIAVFVFQLCARDRAIKLKVLKWHFLRVSTYYNVVAKSLWGVAIIYVSAESGWNKVGN